MRKVILGTTLLIALIAASRLSALWLVSRPSLWLAPPLRVARLRPLSLARLHLLDAGPVRLPSENIRRRACGAVPARVFGRTCSDHSPAGRPSKRVAISRQGRRAGNSLRKPAHDPPTAVFNKTGRWPSLSHTRGSSLKPHLGCVVLTRPEFSILEPDGKRFYWPAIAGRWAEHLGGGTPRNFGPCGTVLDRNAVLLFSHWLLWLRLPTTLCSLLGPASARNPS